nr:hypothetical protein [uncultured Roseateles sp.]
MFRRLALQADANGIVQTVQVHRGSGAWVSFVRNGSNSYAPDADIADRLYKVADQWRYVDASRHALETYDGNGVLLSVHYADGRSISYIYSDAAISADIAPGAGYMIELRDHADRSLRLAYDGSGRLKQVTDPAQKVIGLAYGAPGHLNQLTWQDSTVRKFHYEDASYPWALTGITGEDAVRHSIYAYDAQGRAISTELAGGVNRYSVVYGTPPSRTATETFDPTTRLLWREFGWQAPTGTVVTDPEDGNLGLSAALTQGMPRLTSRSQPAGSGCAASSKGLSYDANGNVEREDDFNGSRTCRAHDLSRNLETSRVEGLANGAVCSAVLAGNASLPTGSRKISSQWHPDWRLATKTAEPGQLTTRIYNGQPDPFNANAIASCAPASALLPDGKPIVVLCRQVEQATTDTNGALGFSATLQASVPNRVQQYTYNLFGQVLTAKDPLNNTTTYAYHSDTTAAHTKGDLQSITNALGQVTQFTQYNPHGQLLQQIDANGITTDYSYDLRQRLTSVAVAGQTTQYVYWPTGLLKRVIQPDESFVAYEYDDAHRLIAVSDNRGNRIDYTLDNAGKRTAEVVKDSGGVLSRQVTRAMDALGRVQQTTGRE